MQKLKKEELMNINGGAKLFWYLLGGLAIVAVGILDGFRNPLKCNN